MDNLIYKKLAEVNRKVKALPKLRENQAQHFKFRGIDDVMNVLHNAFAEAGIIIIQEVEDYTIDERATVKGTVNYCTHATINFHFVAEDGSEVKAKAVGEACDTGDKSMNKAMSIALKYVLLQMFLIPTDEDKDPDSTTPEETVAKGILLETAIKDLDAVKSRAEFEDVWKKYPSLQKTEEFIGKCKEIGQKYPRTNK